MIDIKQTVSYIELCRKSGIDLIPRTEEEMNDVISNEVNTEVRNGFLDLVQAPNTGPAYMELLRVCMSLRAMGAIEPNHPSAMINVCNFQKEVLHLEPKAVVEFVRPFKFGYLEKYGSYLEYAETTHNLLTDLDLLGGVYDQCNLNRVLALHRIATDTELSSDMETALTPIYATK